MPDKSLGSFFATELEKLHAEQKQILREQLWPDVQSHAGPHFALGCD